MLKGKTVVVGVCGGIAAYKAADVVSRLKKMGAEVRVMMTRAATEFISPLTFQSLSQNLVSVEMFAPPSHWEIGHISLANAADVMLIVPATANIIGKIASGIADDLVSTTVMATKAPVIIAPAMNCNMYSNPVTTGNIEKLAGLGYRFIEPASGRLACGIDGKGRLAPVDEIVDSVLETLLFPNKDLKGKNILITAGATRESIDPVRFITNHSSGKMGYELARAAKYRGGNVTLVSGAAEVSPPKGVEIIRITTADEMYTEVINRAEGADIIIKAAAVGDYKAVAPCESKIKKTDSNMTLELTKNRDILKELGGKYGDSEKIIVGFCMETENLIENARKKLKDKKASMIVANSLTEEGAGFGGDTNIVTLIKKGKEPESLPKMTKFEVANKIFDKILK